LPNLTGDKFKVVLAEFSTLSLAVFITVSVLRGVILAKVSAYKLKFVRGGVCPDSTVVAH
jgi:hypothetical protein